MKYTPLYPWNFFSTHVLDSKQRWYKYLDYTNRDFEQFLKYLQPQLRHLVQPKNKPNIYIYIYIYIYILKKVDIERELYSITLYLSLSLSRIILSRSFFVSIKPIYLPIPIPSSQIHSIYARPYVCVCMCVPVCVSICFAVSSIFVVSSLAIRDKPLNVQIESRRNDIFLARKNNSKQRC